MGSELPPGFALDAPPAAALPPGFTLDPTPAPAPELSLQEKIAQGPAAVPEALAQMSTGAVGSSVAGLGGIAQGIKNFIAPDPTNMSAADRVRTIQEAMTYQPRTQGGQKTASMISYPFQKLGEVADTAGGWMTDATGSPAIGTVANVGVQLLPSLIPGAGVLGKARAAVTGEAGTAARAVAGRIEPTLRAQDYVATRTNLDWNALSEHVKDTLTKIAGDSKALEHLDPKALETQARLESLDVPVPATSGQLSRNPVQLRNEGNVSATQAGKPIRDVYLAQNKALLDNLDVLKGKTGGVADSPAQVGISVQDQALRAKLAAKKQEVSGLYKAAQNAGETQQLVSTQPILDLISKTPDKTHYGYAQSWLNQTGAVGKETTASPTVRKFTQTPDGPKWQTQKIGNDTTRTVSREMSINDLEDLRKAAVAKQANGGEDAYYAGKLKEAIDQATAGGGGDLYKKARAANVEKEREFGDQSAVARLVEQKSGRPLDRATALEDTWTQTVKNGSGEDLMKVRKSLLTGGEKGQQAWRDLQAQTLQYIKDEAGRSVTRFEDGSPNVTAASMERSIKSIGQENLKILFSPETVSKLNQVMEATRTVKTEPPTGFKGSPTFANALAFLEKSMITKIPVIGDTAAGIVKAAANLHDLGRTTREIQAATNSPLSQGLADVKKNAKQAGNRKALSDYARFTPSTQTKQ